VDTDALKNQLDERNTRYRRELEDWFRSWIVDGYAERAGTLWKRDYSSVEAYERSVQPNRERWRAILNPPDLRISGPPESEPVRGLEGLDARYVRLPLGERLRAEAILAIPKSKGPVPLIVSQHGIGSQPEHVFGLIDPEESTIPMPAGSSRRDSPCSRR